MRAPASAAAVYLSWSINRPNKISLTSFFRPDAPVSALIAHPALELSGQPEQYAPRAGSNPNPVADQTRVSPLATRCIASTFR